jgi:hypothetical protein
MNWRAGSLLTLRRFLDDSQTTQLEFEAELSGFSEVLRQLRTLVERLRGHAARPEVPVPPGSEVPASRSGTPEGSAAAVA